METATFALGCFWAPDDLFSQLPGVGEVVVGYAGGTAESPTYENLGDHTESVQVTFDSKVITYLDLLEYFWSWHDATAEQRTQYKSIIFYHNKEQKKLAEQSLTEQQAGTTVKIRTEIKLLDKFYKAENYHQKYYQKLGLRI